MIDSEAQLNRAIRLKKRIDMLKRYQSPRKIQELHELEKQWRYLHPNLRNTVENQLHLPLGDVL